MTTKATKKIKIAALSCSYNRVKKTAAFLTSLVNQEIPEGYSLKVYLLDDDSPDGTANYVKANFPGVSVTNGSGSLFWAGGMRKIWGQVVKKDEYDFFFLFNDDVVLFRDAVARLLAAYHRSTHPANIILGTVLDTEGHGITYGGQKITSRLTANSVNLIPDEAELISCDIGNANIMLVDRATVNKIGILSEVYTHGFADYDYTLTAIENGVKVWIAPGYHGHCENDHGVSWLPQRTPLKKRIAHLYSPKGLAYREHILYLKKHFPLSVPITHVKFWLKTLFPIIYDLFKKEETTLKIG
jgi:GT2 family glycosyltransferase